MKTDSIKKDYDKSEGCVIFLHIPRCGGTTFRSILNKCFNKCYTIKGNISHDEFLKFKNQPNEAEKYDCIMGHMGFGFHDILHKMNNLIDQTFVSTVFLFCICRKDLFH